MIDLGFTHLFYPGQSGQPIVVLLHGTGGDEHDLLELGNRVAPGAGLLSLRGKVVENGMPRFFRRLSEGVFDLDDLAFRTEELAEFITRARIAYDWDDVPVYALGFSNGANIAANLLLQRPDVLDGGILIRVMFPFDPASVPDLTGKPILIQSGLMDMIVPVDQPQRLAELLEKAGADVQFTLRPATHQISQADLDEAYRWWQDKVSKSP